MKVKYLTSIMFGNSKAEDVVIEMLDILHELAIPIKLIVPLGIEGPNVNKSIMEKLSQVKREKELQPLVI